MGPVLDAYNNNNPHSITKITPNKDNKGNEMQLKINVDKRAKTKSNYPKLEVGGVSEFLLYINSTRDFKTVLVWKCIKLRMDYTVDGSLHPRKDLQ